MMEIIIACATHKKMSFAARRDIARSVWSDVFYCSMLLISQHHLMNVMNTQIAKSTHALTGGEISDLMVGFDTKKCFCVCDSGIGE